MMSLERIVLLTLWMQSNASVRVGIPVIFGLAISLKNLK
jgi:hypothetical protein